VEKRKHKRRETGKRKKDRRRNMKIRAKLDHDKWIEKMKNRLKIGV
jgi:hypothetical protein